MAPERKRPRAFVCKNALLRNVIFVSFFFVQNGIGKLNEDNHRDFLAPINHSKYNFAQFFITFSNVMRNNDLPNKVGNMILEVTRKGGLENWSEDLRTFWFELIIYSEISTRSISFIHWMNPRVCVTRNE